MKTSYGVDSKKAMEISYTVEEKFFESYIQEHYDGLLKVFHPDDIKLICTVLMRTEFIMYDKALKALTSMKSKNLYDMCEKVTGFDSEDSAVH